MGTRNLTCVMLGGEYKVAQYGQWDGYPSGQGVTILKFLRERLRSPEKAELFLSSVAGCRFGTSEEIKATWTECGASPSSEYVTMDVSNRHEEKYPHLSRDAGGGILEMILQNGSLMLGNQIDFAGASLFCEWAYAVDFDAGTFEVYRGFNTAPLDPSERFASAKREDSEYYPVKLWVRFPLDDLPTVEDFLTACEETSCEVCDLESRAGQGMRAFKNADGDEAHRCLDAEACLARKTAKSRGNDYANQMAGLMGLEKKE